LEVASVLWDQFVLHANERTITRTEQDDELAA